jgi:phytoene/squalene synthetase
VAIDWRKNHVGKIMGRVYLPQDELAQFELADADIGRFCEGAPINQNWRDMMRFQCRRAREMMLSGRPLALAMPGRFGAELRLIVAGGLRILDKIDTVDGDVFRYRPKLGKWDWLGMSPALLPLQITNPT